MEHVYVERYVNGTCPYFSALTARQMPITQLVPIVT
jgi:hypothetical protein